MNVTGETISGSLSRVGGNSWAQLHDDDQRARRRLRWWGWSIVAVSLLFFSPLLRLVQHALGNEQHSHIPLIPFVAAYLLLTRRHGPAVDVRTSLAGGLLAGTVGVVALIARFQYGTILSVNDALTVLTLAYLSAIVACGFLLLGAKWMSAAVFPLAFLVFMIPLPDAAVYWLERGSVLASADAAAWMLNATGTPMFREGTILALPGIVLEVARECSGIRSSWVLLITSVLASNLFLHSAWRRVVLVAFVIPLGIVRNGFRILVIALLCVHVGPHMIDSVIHHRGGPIFFALSLLPLFALMAWLRRGDGAVAQFRRQSESFTTRTRSAGPVNDSGTKG